MHEFLDKDGKHKTFYLYENDKHDKKAWQKSLQEHKLASKIVFGKPLDKKWKSPGTSYLVNFSRKYPLVQNYKISNVYFSLEMGEILVKNKSLKNPGCKHRYKK